MNWPCHGVGLFNRANVTSNNMIDALFLDLFIFIFFNMALNRVLLPQQKFPSSSLKIKMQQTEMALEDNFPLRELF